MMKTKSREPKSWILKQGIKTSKKENLNRGQKMHLSKKKCILKD